MSSEMRYTDDDLRVIVQDWSESDPDQAVAINLARECLRHRALLARTEAGADGAWGTVVESRMLNENGLCALGVRTERGELKMGDKLYTHPQDASGDAELSELRRVLHKLADYWIAVTRDKDVAHRDRAIIDAYDKGLTKCATELRAAMQAKEAK